LLTASPLKPSNEKRARELAIRLAGASRARRLYGSRGEMWMRTLAALSEAIGEHVAETKAQEVTFALLGEGIAVAGVPILSPPSSVERLIGELKERAVEIISVRKGCEASELEALLSFLCAEAADVAAERGDAWLRERGVEHVRIRHLKLLEAAEMTSFRDVYFRGKRALARELAPGKDAPSFGMVSELARSLLEVVVESKAPIATLLALQDRSDYAVVHSINVAVLTGIQASSLGLPEEQCERIVFAALMHDLGKTKVPEAILTKTSALTANERALLDRHTLEGARLLLQSHGEHRLSAIVALDHHRPCKVGEEPFLPTELCRIADAFDVIRTLRPFDDERSMRGAVAFMLRKMSTRLNTFLLERFATLCGLFERGDNARLTTGEFVKVIEPHRELALRAKVVVLDRGSGIYERDTELDLDELEDHVVGDRIGAPRLVPTLPSRFADLEVEHVEALA
jgi:hypothetical protein